MKLPESVTSGESFTQPVCVYNSGYATLYNVRCVLNCDGLISASAYLGNLEPQQSADKTISIFVTTLSGSQKYGEVYGSLKVYYQDENGEENCAYSNLFTNITAPVVITDEQKAQRKRKSRSSRRCPNGGCRF